MELIRKKEIGALSNPGVLSRQPLTPGNSAGRRVTLTEVHVEPGASQPRHTHPAAEQVWYALRGVGTLLLARDGEEPFSAGDVVRFAQGDVHGLRNDGAEDFVYLSVTAPPQSFESAYEKKTSAGNP